MECVKKFLNYVKWETTSDPESGKHPSTPTQIEFGKFLKTEMEKVGLTDVKMTDKGYLYGTLESNTSKDTPAIGFISHMDTSCDCSGKNINPIIHENYDGKNVVLNKNIIMKVSDFPFLKEMVGKTLITTDGTTLLGADDKAGISEILTMVEVLKTNNISHGKIRIAFTPDEEIGEGADFFDVKEFGCDYAYTVDGGRIDAVEYENFNAASCIVHIKGTNIHPGEAKDKMVNSINIAYEFDNYLPSKARPQFTEGYEGFIHLNNISGNVEETKMHYIIRNHDKNLFEKQKIDFLNACNHFNHKYGDNTIELELTDSYYNMASILSTKMEIVNKAMDAIAKQGIKPITLPIRGGTDGARLTFMGLPCPNLGTGGYNFHGRYECITAEDMNTMVNILIQIVKDSLNE